MRSTGLYPTADEWSMVEEIGTPENINSTYGLMDASGSQLQRVFADHGQNSAHAYPTFETVWAGAARTTGLMSGVAWYHWVAIRGQSGSNIWIANSAPGYAGVYDILTKQDFQRLGGFSLVYLIP